MRGAQALWAVCVHSFFTALVGVGLALLIAGRAALEALTMGPAVELLGLNVGPLALHFALAAALWLTLWASVRWVGKQPAARKRARLVRARAGAALVETLIVITPFLLLTSGLAQLTINNIAGVLTHLAAYQSGRAYWLWQREITDGRVTITSNQVKDVAVAAAAGSLAPVAPGGLNMDGNANTPQIQMLRGIMAAHFDLNNTPPAGSGAAGTVISGGQTEQSFARALDFNTFQQRAARKVSFAHEAIELTVIDTTNQVGVSLTYNHYQAFPWFGWIFGQNKTVDGRAGYYMAIQRTYTLMPQSTIY